MEDSVFKDRTKRLMEVNEVIAKLDPAVRGAAFSLLEDYVVGRSGKNVRPIAPPARSEDVSEDDDEEVRSSFFAKYSGKSHADNAQAVTGYHFSLFGRLPMSTADIKRIADEVTITVPDRPDMTLKNLKDKSGRPIFKIGGGKITPTVHADAYFKERFGVSRGRRKPPAPSTD